MKTLKLTNGSLFQAVELLKQDELVAFPTETVYGLGGNIFSEIAIQKIYEVKGRPKDNPLIAHVSSLSDCEMLAEALPPSFFLLAEAFFPGPLTLVVQKKGEVPSSISGGLGTIALRMPHHDLALALIQSFGKPLVAPSANRSGRPSSTSISHVLQDFEGKIAGVLDGGPCIHGMESTVVDLVSFEKPVLLRYGSLKKEEIEKVLGFSIAVYTQGPKTSPGMKYRHYAPDLPVFVYKKEQDFLEHMKRGKKVLVLSQKSHPFFALPLNQESLYGNLRFAELNGFEEIICYVPFDLDETLHNRLEKIQNESNDH